MTAGRGRRLGDTAGGFLSPRQGARRCRQHRGDAALLPGLGGWDGAAPCPPSITQYRFKVKKASSSAVPQFLPSAQGAIPLARHTHGAADPKAPSLKGPAAAGQSSRQGQKADRSFFSAGSATRHGHSAVFIGSPRQTSSSSSFFMPWVKKCQELAPARQATWELGRQQHEGCCPQPLAPQLPGLDGELVALEGPLAYPCSSHTGRNLGRILVQGIRRD